MFSCFNESKYCYYTFSQMEERHYCKARGLARYVFTGIYDFISCRIFQQASVLHRNDTAITHRIRFVVACKLNIFLLNVLLPF